MTLTAIKAIKGTELLTSRARKARLCRMGDGPLSSPYADVSIEIIRVMMHAICRPWAIGHTTIFSNRIAVAKPESFEILPDQITNDSIVVRWENVENATQYIIQAVHHDHEGDGNDLESVATVT